MKIEKYQINSVEDVKYISLLNMHCVIEKRFIYVYMLEEHLQRYIETGKSIFKIGQTDVKVGNRINDQIYHHGWQTITSSEPVIIAIYEVDSNINDKMIQNRICSAVKDATISKCNKRKTYQHAPSGTEWVNNITISDIENAINYYNGKFLFINNDALTNNFKIENNKENSKYEFVNMLNHLANSYDNSSERNIIRSYIQGIVICSVILGDDYKKCNILFGHKKFINMIEKLFNISFDEFMNKISYYAGNYSDIDEMISMIHDYAKDNDLDMSWIAECFIDFTNGDNDFATNWKRMSAYYYADYLQEYIDKMDFDCKKNKDVKFLIYPGSLAILDMIAEYRKIAIIKYNRKSEKIRHIVENEMTLAFDYGDDFIADFVKQIIYYKYNIKLENIIYINEKSEIYNNKKELIDMPKFDYIVQNPPYSGDLHLDFLKMGLNMLNEKGQMVIIEPATWLINLRTTGNVEKYNEIKELLKDHVKSITIENLNKAFEIGNNTPLSITHIDFSNIHKNINFNYCGEKYIKESLYDCNHIGDRLIFDNIIKKISILSNTAEDYVLKSNNIKSKNCAYLRFGNYMLDTIGKRHFNNTNYLSCTIDTEVGKYFTSYVITGADKHDVSNEIPKSKKGNNCDCLYYDKFDNFEDNKIILENYKDFIWNTKFAKFIIIATTFDRNNGSMKYIPWLDFSKKWTDEMINVYFNFTDDEIKMINDVCTRFEANHSTFKRFIAGPQNN